MSLSSLSSALSLNERWVLLRRQPRGPRKCPPPPPPPHSSPPPLRSLILQGADSSKIRKPASPPPAQPHFPIITTTTKVGRFLFTGILPVFVTHISSFTSLLIQMIPTYILTLAQTTAPTSLFLSEGRTLMLFS